VKGEKKSDWYILGGVTGEKGRGEQHQGAKGQKKKKKKEFQPWGRMLFAIPQGTGRKGRGISKTQWWTEKRRGGGCLIDWPQNRSNQSSMTGARRGKSHQGDGSIHGKQWGEKKRPQLALQREERAYNHERGAGRGRRKWLRLQDRKERGGSSDNGTVGPVGLMDERNECGMKNEGGGERKRPRIYLINGKGEGDALSAKG